MNHHCSALRTADGHTGGKCLIFIKNQPFTKELEKLSDKYHEGRCNAMSISAISASNTYSAAGSVSSQSNVEQLKLEEQKLQKELQQLKVKSSGKSNQMKEKALEQEISKIQQEIQQAGNGASASNAQPSAENQGSDSSPLNSRFPGLNTLA